MSAEEYLKEYGKCSREINYIEECIKNGSISKEEGQEKQKAEYEKQDRIVRDIFRVKKPMDTVLYRRYVLGQKLEDIAEGINYNYSYTRRLHRMGLKELEKVLENS